MKKVYIKEEKGCITDLVEVKEFVMNRIDYREIEVNQFPSDILNGCYQFIDGEFVLDEQKHDEFIKKQNDGNLEYKVQKLEEENRETKVTVDLLVETQADILGGAY